jgi:serine/threonine-protein kinase
LRLCIESNAIEADGGDVGGGNMSHNLIGPAVVDEAARRQFEASWADGAPRPIEDFLPPESQPSYLGTLEELVLIDLEFGWKSWLNRQQAPVDKHVAARETVIGAPSVDTYLDRFPQLRSPEIVGRLVQEEIALRQRFRMPVDLTTYRRRFPAVPIPDDAAGVETEGPAGIEAGRSTDVTAPAVRWDPSTLERLPCRFGGYELVEKLGAGGMGVVFRARQPGTDRDVAVKLLRGDRLGGLSAADRQMFVERFRTEARATARIDHPNIVTVYEVGEVEGIPYYTMRFVRGRSLAELVKEGPINPRDAADVIRKVALAVQQGHDHGVLHRDIKPHNILLDDRDGTPFVADFGLAKLLEENSTQTLSGEVLGSPCYMSPEQAQNTAGVTTRSDVYSLGATLYELLTGRPPFTGKTNLDVLLQVREQEPAPPRQFNAALDRDLEVICLKLLRKEPERRYASAGALADDLANWLNGEPISARPVGRWERITRWSRRNKLASALTVVAALGVLSALVAGWTGYAKTQWALSTSRLSELKARHSEQAAHNTVNDFFTTVSEDLLLNQPGMQPLRAQLLQKALSHYKQYLSDHENDQQLQAEIAATQYRIGRITELLDSSEAALTTYANAQRLQEMLLASDPENLDHIAALSTTLNAQGSALVRLGRPDEALTALEHARQLREQLRAQVPQNVEYQRLAANTVMNIGLAHKSSGVRQVAPQELALARDQFTSSITMRDKALQQKGGDSRKLRRDQAMAWFNLGNFEADIPQRATVAVAALQRAAHQFSRLAGESPEDLEVRRQLAVTWQVLGELQGLLGDPAGADNSYAQAQETLNQLAVENPRVPEFRRLLAGVTLTRAEVAHDRGVWDAAAAYAAQARKLLDPLVIGRDAEIEDRAALATALSVLARAETFRGNRADAVTAATRAQSTLLELSNTNPQEPQFRAQLSRVYLLRAELALAGEEWDSAEELAHRAEMLLIELISGSASITDHRAAYARSLYLQAFLHQHRKDWNAAVQLADRAVPYLEQVLAETGDEGRRAQYAGQLEEVRRLISEAKQDAGVNETVPPIR